MATTTIMAPLPGTFYRKADPDQPPFKSEGDKVVVGDTVGLIEVMKTFSPVIAERPGTIRRFFVDNDDAVMAGEPLYEIED